MIETAQLSDTKRKLLTRYLRGKIEVRSATQTIPHRPPDEAIPLSYAQEQVWLHAQIVPDLPLYNEPVTIHYTGPLDVAALEQSFNEILRRHEAWRTCFVTVDGVPVQKVQPSVSISLIVLDLRDLPEEQREAEAFRIATEDARKPIDLTEVPLFRAKLVRLRDEEYRLYLTLSHIIFDGVAIYRIFLPELAALYDAFAAGNPSPLPEISIQYPDYACWQRRCMPSGISTEDIEYWRRQLGGDLPALYLPVDRQRPRPRTYRGSMYPFLLSHSLTTALRALSQTEKVSLFHILLAGFAALLHRYSGEEVIPIGTVTDGRNRPETQSLLGYFLNAVVLTTDLSGNPSFRELVQRVRNVTVEALEHDSLPFEHLVRELRIQRDPNHSPLFQALITFEPPMPIDNNGWSVALTQSHVDTGVVRFDLSLELEDGPTGITGRFRYSTELFDTATVIRMAAHWQTLLEQAVSNPKQRLSELSVLTNDERHQILVEWNQTAVELPKQQILHQYFEDQVERTPDAPAVTFEGGHLSYRELNCRANQVAHYLKKLGVGPDVLVGLFLERSLEMVVGILGILKAGGGYLPLDANYPKDRLAFMLEDANPPVLLTQSALSPGLPEHKAKVICFDTDQALFDCEPDTNPACLSTPDDVAYAIYTSGSTGKPKGVLNVHRGIVNRLLWMQDTYHLNEPDRVLQKTPYSFDVSVWEFFWPLMTGACLVIARPGGHKDPNYLTNLIIEQKITTVHFVPSMLRIFLESQGVERCSSLRHVMCSGEALSIELQERFFQHLGAELHNLYGPTEASVDVTFWQCMTDTVHSIVPIGKPIWNTQIYLLDKYLQPVPVGIAGELYIGGIGLARGYLNRPELTAQKFISDPISRTPGARLYKTGDLARFLADGNIEYLGRADYQVKIRGFRIELGEIEAILDNHTGVAQSVVMVREDESGDKRLVAYFEPQTGSVPAVGNLRTHLEKELPDYMVPSAFVLMEKLPLTTNGKIDRKALPVGNEERLEIQGEFVAPRDALEKVLAHLWSNVLKVRVGVHDNFFELGGHSLLAVRIIAEIEKLFKRRLPLATLMQAPTISEVAEVLRKEDWRPSWSSLVPIRPGGSKPPLFFMHSHGGNVLEYYPLANHFEADQPVYALQARGLDGHIVKDQSVEQMAAAYLAEVRSLQPEGPYFLGGFCFGGLLALETAQQLTAAGEEVALVVLIQTMNPVFARFRPGTSVLRRWWYRTTKRIDLERENLFYRGRGYIYERGRRVLDIARGRAAIAFDNFIGNGHHRRTDLSMPYILESLAIEHNKTRDKYVPSRYRGDVVLFRSSKQLSGLAADFSLGWKDIVTGKLEICELPGHQEQMLSEPSVTGLAQALTARLQAV